MTYLQKIRRLYNLPEDKNFGFSKTRITQLQKQLNIKLPDKLINYYLTLGKNENINFSHNRLLKPDKEIGFSEDRYLIIYEENQVVVYWGIKEKDLKLSNPPVYGNYSPNEDIADWHLETKTTGDFFLLMAVYNGTLGGLKYNANYFGQIKPKTLKYIEKNWTNVKEISWERQKVYTDNFYEVISLSFDEQNNCEAVFIGTSNKKRFDRVLVNIEIEWSYISYEDEDFEEDD